MILGYNKLQNRYNKLYSPLVHQIIGMCVLDAKHGFSITTKLKLIIRSILKGNFEFAFLWFRYQPDIEYASGERYFITNTSDNFDLKGIQQHIKKYHYLADSKLVELLADAILASRQPDRYFNLEDGGICPEVYHLIYHIQTYSKRLNNKLNPS